MAGCIKRLAITLYITVILAHAHESSEAHYDTIVIGLGSAGVTAASTLAKEGKQVLGLEAQERIGGRVKTVPFGDGIVEEGAEWFDGTHNNRAYDLAVQNNIPTKEQNLSPEVIRSDGGTDNLDLYRELSAFCFGKALERTKDAVPMGNYVPTRLKEYLKEKHPQVLDDKEFLDDFLENMNFLMRTTEGTNDWNDISTANGFEPSGGPTNITWYKHGFKTFFELLLNTYKEGPGIPTLTVKLNKEVTLIKWPQNETGDVEVVCKDGDKYTASNVIVTVSLGVLKERYSELFSPPLPEDKVSSIENLSIGVLDKVILSFAQPWWNNTNNFQIFWTKTDKDQLADDEKWLSHIILAYFPTGSDNTIAFFTSGEAAKLVETLPEDVVKAKLMRMLRKVLGKKYDNIPEPTGLLRSKWHSNPFTRGTVSYDNLLKAQYPNARDTLAQPLLDAGGAPKVLFAGEATNSHHFRTVHGASDTGYREAMRLLATGTD